MLLANKKEYEETLNELLDTSIKWSDLSKDDLVQFTTLVSKPKVFLSKLGVDQKKQSKQTNRPLMRGIIDEVFGDTDIKIGEGQIVKRLKDLLTKETQ